MSKQASKACLFDQYLKERVVDERAPCLKRADEKAQEQVVGNHDQLINSVASTYNCGIFVNLNKFRNFNDFSSTESCGKKCDKLSYK